MLDGTQYRLHVTSTFLNSREQPQVSTMLNLQALFLSLIIRQTDKKQSS